MLDSYEIDGTLTDCEGVALADIDGDGDMDVVSANSTAPVAIYWYQNDAVNGETWTRRTIDAATAGTKIEGVCVGDFDGDGEYEVVTTDQTEGKIRLYKPSTFGAPTGTWDTVVLQASRPNVHSGVAWDIDGDGRVEFVYSFEGDADGVGGVSWLDWNSGAVMTPANWTDYVMVQRDGAWWIMRDRIDLAGSGSAVDIVYTARNNRNPSAAPGVFWLAKPATVTDTWVETTIENRVADWLHVDHGDFFGDGHTNDIAAEDYDGTYAVTIYRKDNNWAATQLNKPNSERCYNLRSFPIGELNHTRTPLLVAFQNSDAYIYHYPKLWLYDASEYVTQNHPFDGDIEWYDINGDGVQEAIISDSSEENPKLIWVKFGYD